MKGSEFGASSFVSGRPCCPFHPAALSRVRPRFLRSHLFPSSSHPREDKTGPRLPRNSRGKKKRENRKKKKTPRSLAPRPLPREWGKPMLNCSSSAPLHPSASGAGPKCGASRRQVLSAPQDACAEPRGTRPQPRPPRRGGIPPSWAGRQLFASWWNVPLETVPRGLFSPPTPGRTVINTATNAHDANWQRECNTSPLLQPNWANCFPFSASPFGLFWFRTHPTGAFLKTCQWLVFVF